MICGDMIIKGKRNSVIKLSKRHFKLSSVRIKGGSQKRRETGNGLQKVQPYKGGNRPK